MRDDTPQSLLRGATWRQIAALVLRPRSPSRSTLVLLSGNLGTALLAFGLSVLIGRGLGVENLGVYATVLSWVFPLIMLAEWGTNTLLTRDLSVDSRLTSIYLKQTHRIRMAIGVPLMVGLWGAAPMLSANPLVVNGLRWSVPLLVIEPAFGAYTAIFRAQRRMEPIPVLNVGMLVVQLILSALWIAGAGHISGVLAINSVTSGGRFIAAWMIYRAHYRVKVDERDVTIARRDLVQWAMPFAVAGILAAGQMRINLVMLELVLGTAAVGYYAAATRFVEAARIIPQALFDALLPTLSALADDLKRQRSVFRSAFYLTVGYGIAAAVGFSVAAPTLMRATYGNTFSNSIPVMIWAGWLLIPALMRSVQVLHAYARQQEHTVNRMLAAMLAARIGLTLVLIPSYGVVGAVWAGGIVEFGGWVYLSAKNRS